MTAPGTSREEAHCYHHPDTVAAGTCSVCGKPVCGDCAVHVERALVCNVEDHRLLARTWAIVHHSGTEFEASMISKNLEFGGIPTKVFSSLVFKETLGAHPADIVRVFAQKEDLGRAQELLQNLGLREIELQGDRA